MDEDTEIFVWQCNVSISLWTKTKSPTCHPSAYSVCQASVWYSSILPCPHIMSFEQQKSLHPLFSVFLNYRLTLPPLQTAVLKLLKSFEGDIWKGSSSLSEHAAGQYLNKWIQLVNPCLKDQSLCLCKEQLWKDRCQRPMHWCILEFVGVREGRALIDSRASSGLGSRCLKNPDRKDQDLCLDYWLTEIIYLPTQKMAKAH